MAVAKLTEAKFTKMVIDLAHLFGWRTAHFRPGMNRRGKWSTPVQGDGAGFFDLVLVRDRLIAAELKIGRGKLTPAQRDWLDAFRRAGVTAVVWCEKDWDQITRTLAE